MIYQVIVNSNYLSLPPLLKWIYRIVAWINWSILQIQRTTLLNNHSACFVLQPAKKMCNLNARRLMWSLITSEKKKFSTVRKFLKRIVGYRWKETKPIKRLYSVVNQNRTVSRELRKSLERNTSEMLELLRKHFMKERWMTQQVDIVNWSEYRPEAW